MWIYTGHLPIWKDVKTSGLPGGESNNNLKHLLAQVAYIQLNYTSEDFKTGPVTKHKDNFSTIFKSSFLNLKWKNEL